MRDLPNMTVIAPSDSAQCIKAIRATLEYPGPVCFRIARGAEPAVYTTQDYDYEVGKAITALDGHRPHHHRHRLARRAVHLCGKRTCKEGISGSA